ncbi:reverse transcriptase [Gossypium australe]|uniref:Reverse transcriptase n=1 Tax=Gossypium australe TaxID=47621 RepID=A0A5B6VEY3_9ROSI|nr:reverse transcriptase [Gossypium australe]
MVFITETKIDEKRMEKIRRRCGFVHGIDVEAEGSRGKDVETFCLGILNDGKDFDSLNLTDIMLIPKIPNPTSLVNFKPISLCTVIYKIVTKTITNRLQEIIGRCIDSAQSAFAPGRLISNNVLLAYEILHTLR